MGNWLDRNLPVLLNFFRHCETLRKKDPTLICMFLSVIFQCSHLVDYLSQQEKIDKLDLQFLLFSDGKPIHNSALWPIFLCCLSLPPHVRYKPQNMILYGCTSRAPTSFLPYLRPLMEELQSAHSDGFKIGKHLFHVCSNCL
jgi:hypothetical protein